ncbi:MAG TPA: type I pullulanase [Puia sp.]|jgi:pullulanase|nr:type I pullulanase [Puia sp.]
MNLIVAAILAIRMTAPVELSSPPDTLPAYDRYPVYTGTDLGLTYSPAASVFRIWSPTAQQARLYLYTNLKDAIPYKVVELTKGENGTWWTRLAGDWKGVGYTFSVYINNGWSQERPDPYARAVWINGKRAVVLAPGQTDPPGWQQDKSPAFSANDRPTDAVIYELHLRDISVGRGSGIRAKGKFTGLGEWGTRNGDGLATGLTYLKELGVTHLHILPFFDFYSVDERRVDSPEYNWGYDPLNYNVPEGSYSSNANLAYVRNMELKEMIASVHRHGLRVIMDVVYNHTATALMGTSCFNELAPGYYYRQNADGSFSNATGCGNETASERPMFRKYMLESVLYWMKEYHIDGFRFDLMGVHDIGTMNLIADSVHRLRPDVLLYGEGWTAGSSPLPDSLQALKKNVARLHGIAVFGDDMRDGIKGSVFDAHDRGFVAGNVNDVESVKFGIAGACYQPQIDYGKVNYSHAAYATEPSQEITYCECHDNNTLWDKLGLSRPDAVVPDRERMQRLAWAIVLTSQGIPFLYEGTEFLHSKRGLDNSYNSGDSINAIDWSVEKERLPDVRYLRALIRMRREHPAFRLTTAAQIGADLHFEDAPDGCIVYTLDGAAVHDSWSGIWVAFNGTGEARRMTLPAGEWKAALPGATLGAAAGSGSAASGSAAGSGSASKGGAVTVGAYSAVILYR